MTSFTPKLSSTAVSENNYEWRSSNFKNLLIEIESLRAVAGEALLFRGHRKSDWLLDSTFARSLKFQQNMPLIDRYSDEIINDVDSQHCFAQQYLDKINQLIINPELQKLSKEIDPLFEVHRHRNQNPNDSRFPDIEPKGTCFLDFTQDWRIGLFFANFHRQSNEEGALFVIFQPHVGTVHISIPFKSVLDELKQSIKKSPEKMYGHLPLLIFPKAQINNSLDPKPKLQKAIYFAQMDFRMDFEISWKLLHEDTGKKNFVKMILPCQSNYEIDQFLTDQSITESYLFPDTVFDCHKIKGRNYGE